MPIILEIGFDDLIAEIILGIKVDLLELTDVA